MRALVLSGGGSKGAYQVGALRHLIGELRTRYDILCGVSVGALNTSFLSMYKDGQEASAFASLEELWSGLDDSKIYKNWFPFGKLSVLWKSSVYNSSPLQEIVRTKLDPKKIQESGKKLRVGATNLVTGEYKLFGEDYSDVQGAVLASSAFPVMFCPISLEGALWTDGGIREVTPIKAAIDLGATAIDVVICSPDHSKFGFPQNSKTLQMAERAIDIISDSVLADDVKIALLINQLVNAGKSDKRYVPINLIRPANVLTDNSLDFSPALRASMEAKGYDDAKAAIV